MKMRRTMMIKIATRMRGIEIKMRKESTPRKMRKQMDMLKKVMLKRVVLKGNTMERSMPMPKKHTPKR